MNWIEALPYLQFWGVTLLVLLGLYGWLGVIDRLLVKYFLKKRRGA